MGVMKPGMRMMLMDRVKQKSEDDYRNAYGGDEWRRMIGYDRDHDVENRRMAYGMDEPESRRRRDGRGRYMEGGSSYRMGGYDTESRRRRDRNGRYMMDDDDRDENDEMRSRAWYPPMGMNPGNTYGDIYAKGTIYAPGAMNKPLSGGMAYSEMSQPVDEHTARMWVQKMDGGEKFKMEQAEQFRQAHCPHCDKYEFYVALNAMYSDYCEVAKKLGVDKPEFYIFMAKAFLDDKDAGPHKLRKYMETIPK